MWLVRQEIPFRWNIHRWWKLNLLQESQIQKDMARSMTAFNISNQNRIYCGRSRNISAYYEIQRKCLLWISRTLTKYFCVIVIEEILSGYGNQLPLFTACLRFANALQYTVMSVEGEVISIETFFANVSSLDYDVIDCMQHSLQVQCFQQTARHR